MPELGLGWDFAGQRRRSSSFEIEGTALAKAGDVKVQSYWGGHWSLTGGGSDRYGEGTIAGDVAKDSGWKCKHPGQGNHKQIVVCPHEETVLLSNERAND